MGLHSRRRLVPELQEARLVPEARGLGPELQEVQGGQPIGPGAASSEVQGVAVPAGRKQGAEPETRTLVPEHGSQGAVDEGSTSFVPVRQCVQERKREALACVCVNKSIVPKSIGRREEGSTALDPRDASSGFEHSELVRQQQERPILVSALRWL